MTVTQQELTVKKFPAAEIKHNFANISCSRPLIQTCNFSLERLKISCGHGSKLLLCVDVEIVITGLQPPQLWCADRWQLSPPRMEKSINLRWKGQFERIFSLTNIQVSQIYVFFMFALTTIFIWQICPVLVDLSCFWNVVLQRSWSWWNMTQSCV